jgi:putative aldouronate transport system permease protein
MKRAGNFGDITFQLCNGVLLLLLGVVTLYPFLNLLAISLNDSMDTMRGGIYLLPREFTWSNYETIFQNPRLITGTFISISRTVLGTVLSIVATTMVAYALSRREFVLRKIINTILIISLYVNGGLIPYYILIKNLHLSNSFLVYILPALISAFHVIIIRSYFEQLPEGLIESAQLDGASEFQVLFHIVVFVSLPVLATIVLFISVTQWNSWFDNYLFNSNVKLTTLQYELMKILTNSVESVTASATGRMDEEVLKTISPESIRASMTIIVTVPILFVYPFMQKYFIKGFTVGAMKE